MTADFFSLVAQMSALEGQPRLSAPKIKEGDHRSHDCGRGEQCSAEIFERCVRDKTEAEILRGTGRTHSAVSWALLFLRRIGMVESVPDYKRNLRYLRYRAAR